MSRLPDQDSTRFPYVWLSNLHKRPWFVVFINTYGNSTNGKLIGRLHSPFEFSCGRKMYTFCVHLTPWFFSKRTRPRPASELFTQSLKSLAILYTKTGLRTKFPSLKMRRFNFEWLSAVFAQLFHNKSILEIAGLSTAPYLKSAEAEVSTPTLFDFINQTA